MKVKLGSYKNNLPENGLALFCGYQILEGDKRKKICIEFEPYVPLHHGLYSCGSTFKTEILREQLLANNPYGFVIVDGNGFSFWVINGNVKQNLYSWDKANLPKKHGRGGQSSNRFARIRTEKRHNYITKVSEACVQHFISQETNMPIVKNILLAGFGELKTQLRRELDPRLDAIICASVDIQYGGPQGLNEAIDKSQEILSGLEYFKEQQVISLFFEEINKGSDLYTFGVVDTLYAYEAGAVDTLIVDADIEFARYEVRHVDKENTEILYLKEHPGEEYEVISETPVFEYILETNQSLGSKLEIITSASPDGTQFCQGFTGIGSIMKFRLDLPSQMCDDFEDSSGSDVWEW
jgi:peptide chain release factor subunit 1